MLRSLAELTAEVAASLDATRLRHLQVALPAALRVSACLVRGEVSFLYSLVEEGKIELEDFITLLHYHGIRSAPYEGRRCPPD